MWFNSRANPVGKARRAALDCTAAASNRRGLHESLVDRSAFIKVWVVSWVAAMRFVAETRSPGTRVVSNSSRRLRRFCLHPTQSPVSSHRGVLISPPDGHRRSLAVPVATAIASATCFTRLLTAAHHASVGTPRTRCCSPAQPAPHHAQTQTARLEPPGTCRAIPPGRPASATARSECRHH